MGDKKADEPPIATAIRKGSVETPRVHCHPDPNRRHQYDRGGVVYEVGEEHGDDEDDSKHHPRRHGTAQVRDRPMHPRRAAGCLQGFTHGDHGAQQNNDRPVYGLISGLQCHEAAHHKDGYRGREGNVDWQNVEGSEQQGA